MLITPPPSWVKDVQELNSFELDKLEADIKSGKLSEREAEPLLLHAALRAAGKALAGEAPGAAP